MKFELLRSSHSVGESNLHLQFMPAYRRDIFIDELVYILVRDYLFAVANKLGFEILAIGFGGITK
jgi:REP element-mobilizing transposase RayT